MPGLLQSAEPAPAKAGDTFYVGTLKGVGQVCQQTVIDTSAKVAFAKLYDRKTPITAAEILNDRVVPFYEEHKRRIGGGTYSDAGRQSGIASRSYPDDRLAIPRHVAVPHLPDLIRCRGQPG